METVIQELDPRKCSELVEEIARMERKIFPKHESLARSLKQDLKTKNSGLIYAKAGSEGRGDGEIVGYVMYSWISSLCASITKLAVKESYRRQGHGEALLKAGIQKCRRGRVQRVCLHVDPERFLLFHFTKNLVSKLMILLSLTILLIEMLIECTWIFDC
ncbi:hypothetical protein KSP40_PGU018345 [Platanthera guangdongensis]|uniref:N-acetyltransferase domain-containing protein n=1 Tax=Platanthera guangdongensis TaxID=2320717 RepID=A0ABR2LHP5_9ASPA